MNAADRPDPHTNGYGGVRPGSRPDTLRATPGRPGSGQVSRLDRVTLQLGVAVAVVIALCSYAVSATSLYALGAQAGYSSWQAAAVPVVADGPAIYGMFRIVSRSRRGAKRSPAWLPKPRPATARACSSRPASSPIPRRFDAATPPPNQHPSPGTFSPGRRALPAGPAEPTANGTVGARLQAAFGQPRTDGQPWTARTLAEAAGCGRSSAAAFLQRHRPSTEEQTP